MKYFVYLLSDSNGVFYVGKGCKDRPKAHIREAKKYAKTGCASNIPKCERIVAANFAIDITIDSYHMDSRSALDREAELIATLDGLTNNKSGFEEVRFKDDIDDYMKTPSDSEGIRIIGYWSTKERHEQLNMSEKLLLAAIEKNYRNRDLAIAQQMGELMAGVIRYALEERPVRQP